MRGMRIKRLFAKLKRLTARSYVLAILVIVAAYALLCYLYWLVEIGPGGNKTYLDILLWNNVNIIFSRGYTDYVPDMNLLNKLK